MVYEQKRHHTGHARLFSFELLDELKGDICRGVDPKKRPWLQVADQLFLNNKDFGTFWEVQSLPDTKRTTVVLHRLPIGIGISTVEDQNIETKVGI